ncbi:hypothetical protein IW261DRAFT_1610660 [Armillaria novae-zelandiae]|uniref:Uncharacterized protein n=1 Tax=Armillaria novae-zelandiae TaxID=153914 RepID=A0AA39NYI1_9AGAR|nr:hypothetical protein IW261DRAFT_1610660 [Armillaria novae-zelandiae]
MPQNNYNVIDKWTSIAMAVLSSPNAGTGMYLLALICVSVHPLAYALLPPLKPSSAIKLFKNTINATIEYHKKHESLQDGSISIGRVEELLTEARALKLMHVKAYQGLSLSSGRSWVRYAHDGWVIWVKTRAYQREINMLKGEFKILVLQAKTQAPAKGGSREVLNGQDGNGAPSANRAEGPNSIVLMSIEKIFCERHEHDIRPTPASSPMIDKAHEQGKIPAIKLVTAPCVIHREHMHNQTFPTLERHTVSPVQVICHRFASPTSSFRFLSVPFHQLLCTWPSSTSLDKTGDLFSDVDVRGQSTTTLEENIKNVTTSERDCGAVEDPCSPAVDVNNIDIGYIRLVEQRSRWPSEMPIFLPWLPWWLYRFSAFPPFLNCFSAEEPLENFCLFFYVITWFPEKDIGGEGYIMGFGEWCTNNRGAAMSQTRSLRVSHRFLQARRVLRALGR